MRANRKKNVSERSRVIRATQYRNLPRDGGVLPTRLAPTQTDTQQNSAPRIAPAGLFFESAAVRSWYSGSGALPVLGPGVLPANTTDTSSVLTDAASLSDESTNSATTADCNAPSRNPSLPPRPPSERCSANVYTEGELLEMDAAMAFTVPSPDQANRLTTEAVTKMSKAWEQTETCCVCEMMFPRSDIESKEVTGDLIKMMRQCLKVHPDAEVPGFVVKQYDVSDIHSRFQGLLLQRSGVVVDGNTIWMKWCVACRNHIQSQKYTIPPPCAISNGNYIGHLPTEYKALTQTDEQAVALILPCVSLSVVSGGSCKTIKSHHYVVQNTEGPIIEMLPRDLTSRVRVTMVGSMTSTQVAACKKKYKLNLALCNTFLCFLDRENREYKNRSRSANAAPPRNLQLIPTSVIVDRTARQDSVPDSADVVASIRDESTYSTFGSAVEEGQAQDQTVESTWIGASSLLLQPQQQDWADVLVRKSNVYESMAKWAICVRLFPTRGCGGPVEPRLNPMSIHGHRFETHHAFMLLAFDYLASDNARRTLYVKMNVRRQALKAAEIPRTTVREAISYFNHLTECRSRGIKPRPPSLDVQHVIDLRKGLHVPESAFYGSNSGRMRARHDLFGLLKRFGPLQMFFTVSPDSAGTYSIAIKSGRVTEKVVSDANLALLPSRAERKSIAAMHPVECARYFLRVMETVVEVLLGWDSKARAPKRVGGIFGVVRAFGAAAETQLAGDLHVHIAVWLHGFPSTAESYKNAMQTNPDFQHRLLVLADSVLCTKPPCLVNELRCPSCLTDDSLKPITPGVDAFRRPAAGVSPPATSHCNNCDQAFRDKEIINLTFQAAADGHHIHVECGAVDFEKCRPPQTSDTGVLATSLLVRDVQTHYWHHCKSCFKSTVRTPKGSVCRFFKPEEVQLGATTIEDDSKLRLHRAIGCEYVNAYNSVVMTTLKCNHDAQFVISSGAKDTAAYVVKYCCKSQNPVENYAALSLAAFAKAAKKSSALPSDTTAMERGYRILGSMLYTVTNGQEVAASMAALYILRESPFWFSHEFVHINLKNLIHKQLDSIEITVSQEICEDGASNLARVTTDNVLERYWHRVETLDHICFMEICEHYEYSGKSTNIGSVNSSNLVSFSRTRNRKVAVLCGDEIPDITTNLTQDRIDYYYSAILTLFKPHRKSGLLEEGQSPLQSYCLFLQCGRAHDIQRLQQYETQWRDFYRAQRNDDREEESPEERLLRTRDPPTASSVRTSGIYGQYRDYDDESMGEPVPDDLLDAAALVAPDVSTSKLVIDAETTTGTIANLGSAILSTCKLYTPTSSVALPPDFSFKSYQSRVIIPQDVSDRCGTEEFIEAFPTRMTRLERLQECYGPVPYSNPPLEPHCTPESLPLFPTIACVSGAFNLNFWQHVMFEVAARHLLYAYATDIEGATGEALCSSQTAPTAYDIKPQLIAYLGGQAGTGKSTVVEALLAFARQWGRAGSVETLAFTGAAAINIHGSTMHSSRNLKLNGAESNAPPSNEMKARFKQVVLVIVDEISITDQALLGGTDSVSRMMSMTPGKFMGGKHVMLLGDFFQLPPVGGHPCFQPPSCTANRLRHAGYALYSSINLVVFLTKNMRARTDPIYAEILDCLRWGRLSDGQLAVLNTRVQSSVNCDSEASSSESFYRPFVVATNRLRCAINNRMIFQVAANSRVTVYECLASASSRSKSIVDNLLNLPDDLTDRVPMKLLFYIGMPIMVTRKHPLLLDADIIANGVVGTIVGMHPAPHELDTLRYSVENVIIHRLVRRPELLLIKLFGSHTTLISGFGDGVVGLPLLHARLQLTKIPNLAQASITVDQFAVVPAFSCTTEKLQGQTCHDGVVVTPLKRQRGAPNQTLYVALSRAVSLNGLTLTEEITKEYLNNFKPNKATVLEIQRLIQLVVLPPYASEADKSEFNQWKLEQHA